MKRKEAIKSILKFIRMAVGWILTVLGSFVGLISGIGAVVSLFGGMKTESFGEQVGFCVIFLILMCVGIRVQVEGCWIKNGSFEKKQPKPKETLLQPKETLQQPKETCLQPTEARRRLEEIEQKINNTAGAIQANPMSPGRGAGEVELAALQLEKWTRLRRMAKYMESVTVQDAWNTFPPERQQSFDAQVYQYSQDVNRGGLECEIAAANRGLMFVDARPVPKEVAARLQELQIAASAEKERSKTMTLQPMDYPVPFTELLIYPERFTKRPKTAQILHDEENGSFGSRSREAVYLFEEKGRSVLVCEKQHQDEHSPQLDRTWAVRAKLFQVPRGVHYIPLTKWILSLPRWENLRQFTDEILVKLPPDAPQKHPFDQYRKIKESHMKNSHDQPGWNCTYDEIGLGFDGIRWHLCRTIRWRESPSGQIYHVDIVMKLLPGVEKESKETLCGLMSSLPWCDPDSADEFMWVARNWLSKGWLDRQAEFENSMHRKNPHNDAYEKALDEVLRQLYVLEEQESEEEEMKKKKLETASMFEPASGSKLKGYRMDMHTTSGEKYHFILSGLVNFNPNSSSRCGYGCDDWLFHCTAEGAEYILNFSDEASYGRCWSCVPISPEDARNLKTMEATDWLKLMHERAKEGKQILHLHPDHAAEARAAMEIHSSRCGPIGDNDFYGQ